MPVEPRSVGSVSDQLREPAAEQLPEAGVERDLERRERRPELRRDQRVEVGDQRPRAGDRVAQVAVLRVERLEALANGAVLVDRERVGGAQLVEPAAQRREAAGRRAARPGARRTVQRGTSRSSAASRAAVSPWRHASILAVGASRRDPRRGDRSTRRRPRARGGAGRPRRARELHEHLLAQRVERHPSPRGTRRRLHATGRRRRAAARAPRSRLAPPRRAARVRHGRRRAGPRATSRAAASRAAAAASSPATASRSAAATCSRSASAARSRCAPAIRPSARAGRRLGPSATALAGAPRLLTAGGVDRQPVAPGAEVGGACLPRGDGPGGRPPHRPRRS